MQIGLIFLLGLALTVCFQPARAGLDDDIVNLLEEFRARMCHPFPKLGLPALDPFEIAHSERYLDGDIFKDFSTSVTNLSATGLSDFIINEIKISTISRKFTFDLTFPLTKAESLYTAKGSLAYIVNLVGDDNLLAQVKEVRIIINGGIKVGLKFGIKNLKIQFKIENLFVDFGQIMEHDRLNNFVHNVINDLTLELLGDFWEDFGDSYTLKIEDLINEKMSAYTLSEIIGIISGSGSGEPIFGDDPPGDCKDVVEESHIKPSVILKGRN